MPSLSIAPMRWSLLAGMVGICNSAYWSQVPVPPPLWHVHNSPPCPPLYSDPAPPMQMHSLCCTETCRYSSDGDCDDGGSGSEYFGYCDLGTDCTDCGSRCSHPSPPWPPQPQSPQTPPPTPPSAPPSPGALFTFEDDNMPGWSTPRGAYPLTRKSGPTPSGNTGPLTAFGGQGYYYYTEASSPRTAGDVFELRYVANARRVQPHRSHSQRAYLTSSEQLLAGFAEQGLDESSCFCTLFTLSLQV
jgi:hypothetical protein